MKQVLTISLCIMVFACNVYAQQAPGASVAPSPQAQTGQSFQYGQTAPYGQQTMQQPASPMQQPSFQQGLQTGQQMPSQYPAQQGTPVAPESAKTQQTAPDVQQPASGTISEFEQFISGRTPTTISTAIQQFGYNLFTRPPSTFAPVDKVPVGPDYVVGPGDELRITIWGNIEGQWTAIVDRDGNITLPKVGILGVTGLTFQELKDTLHKQLAKYYTNFEMNVSMGNLRTIRVYLVGNAVRPGAYTISSLSTLVNALFESGGPSKKGTMRDVQLKRRGKTVARFDIYDFLLKGDKTRDIRLMPEDVIFIPSVGPLVAIAGNIKNPAIYELKGESKLSDVLSMAGGLTATAFKGRVQVQRIENHKFRTIFEGDLIDIDRHLEKDFVVQDGDLVKVFAVVDTKNTIMISGPVANPGEYGITPGVTRIRDIIALSGGTLYYASKDAELTRIKVTQSGPQTERLPIDLSRAVQGDPQHNITMEINDYLFIRSVPEWDLYKTVTVGGEVKYPGVYTVQKGERLSSLLERAGGYTDKAYLRGAVFTRVRVRELQQKNLEEVSVRLERELLSAGASQMSAAISREEIEAKRAEYEQKQKFIDTLKRLKATGRFTIRLAHLRLLKGSEYDIELEEGDILHIPSAINVVNVAGSTMFQGSFLYSENLSYKDYIEMSGGYTRNADESNVFILKADGSAMKPKSSIFWNSNRSRWEIAALGETVKEVEPGDTVVVPEKIERVAWLRDIKDITQILANVALT
ncbi:MAG TPA: SLBB domain-containing protein, partial [Syntrophorhabdaceae bacterium]|nr:SLBB domain-containing protein [Syntrophorhabdaceae bacterium]